MKKTFLILGIVVVIVLVFVLKGSPSEDVVVNTPHESLCGMTVVAPLNGENFSDLGVVEVVVDNTKREEIGCSWTVFEAQAGTFALFDGEGTQVGFGILQAKDGADWMTAEPVAYSGEIVLDLGLTPAEGLGTLIITEDDPSGEKVVSKKQIPINF